MPAPPTIDCTRPVKLADRPGIAEQYHLFDDDSAMAIRAALAARRPLLVRGEPGVGKTQLAAAAAIVLERPIVSKVVDSRTEARDLLWEFDAVMRLADAQMAAVLGRGGDGDGALPDPTARLAIGNYIRPGTLWWAFDWPSAAKQATRTQTPIPPIPPGCDPSNGCVVLIDEIDKADSDVPNGLLESLGSGSFTPYGQSQAIEVKGEPPLVVITTNEERVLPNAFLRRCLILELKLPREESKLIERLKTIGGVHFPNRMDTSGSLFHQAAELLVKDRRTAIERSLLPLPGQAEYLDLLRAVFALEASSGRDADDLLRSVARFAVRKYEQTAQ
jgi:MoxR-like ATPase